MLGQDLVVAINASDAVELIAQAGLDTSDGDWLLPDGTHTSDRQVALASALAVIASKYREGRRIELDAEVTESVRTGLASILARGYLPDDQQKSASALLKAVGATAADTQAPLMLDLTQHRLTLLAALHTRINMLGHSPEDEELVGTLSDVQLKVDRRGMSSDWLEGEGEW
jgi:hypothetical protein